MLGDGMVDAVLFSLMIWFEKKGVPDDLRA